MIASVTFFIQTLSAFLKFFAGFMWIVMILWTLCAACLAYAQFKPRQPSASSSNQELPGVSILRPLRGVDVNLEQDLESSFKLDYQNKEILLSVADKDDPAIDIARRVIKRYPKVESKLIIGEEDIGVNPKINNMIKSYRDAKYDLIWICDSNIHVDSDTLLHAIPHFDDENVGIVHHAPEGINGMSSIGAQLEENFLNTAHAKIYLVFNFIKIDSCVMGKSTIFKRSVLNKVGGLQNFGKYLAEDNMIGIAIWNMGLKHVMSVKTAQQSLLKSTVLDYIKRRSRWTRIRAYSMPVVTILEPFTESIVSGLTGAYTFHQIFHLSFLKFFVFHMIYWLICDILIILFITRKPIKNVFWILFTWGLRELSAVPIYLYSIFGSNVVNWRGREYMLRLGGLVDRIDNYELDEGVTGSQQRLQMIKNFGSCFVVDILVFLFWLPFDLIQRQKTYSNTQ